jgi:hypothetical protein
MKLKFFLWPLVGSFSLLTIDAYAAKGAQQRRDLTIVYTNDVLGEIEPCG